MPAVCKKSQISLVPGERIELPTNGLQNRCSTAELTRHPQQFQSLSVLVPFEKGRIGTDLAGDFLSKPRIDPLRSLVL